MEKQEFIKKIAALVKKYAGLYGITVHSPIIGQAILESGWGESKLAAVYHNYFGLKCGTAWKGKSVNMTTKEEYTAGTLTTIKDNFRVYDSMEEGVKGYFEFIQLTRYANLKGITDPKVYLNTIKADGYATSSTYVNNVYALIVQYNLTQYDKNVDNVDNSKKEGTKVGYSRQAVVDLVESWIGKNEADGSYKSIINIYNSFTGKFPRNTKMEYSWAWCACCWSALAVALKYTAIMPIEISCYYLIEEAKKMGVWVENDAYVPKPGDAVLYDWNDTGKGDCTGTPDHVGTVTYTNKEAGYFVVTEGNYNDAVKKRTVSINGRYIRGFIVPKYDTDTAVPNPVRKPGKTVKEVAHEAIAGQWGNGDERVSALRICGYDPVAVQTEVNSILNGSAVTTDKTKQDSNQAITRTVKATCYAKKKNPAIAGSYVTTADLYCRNDAGTNKKALCLIPKGTTVHNYGYYNVANGVKWLYITVTLDGTEYIGFSSSAYLKKK